MTRKQVNSVLDELAVLVERHVKKRSVGEFVLAGLIKIHTVKRPAKKSYKGTNPLPAKRQPLKHDLPLWRLRFMRLKVLRIWRSSCR